MPRCPVNYVMHNDNKGFISIQNWKNYMIKKKKKKKENGIY